MYRPRTNFALVLSTLALLAGFDAVSETLQFERIATPGGDQIFVAAQPYTEANFQLIGDTDFRVLSSTFVSLEISNGTDVGFVQSPPAFTLSTVGGEVFSMQCLVAGQGFGAAAGTLTVTGTLAAGGTLTEVFSTASDAFTTFELPSTWINLSSVAFVSTSNFLAVDNICVTPGSTSTVVFEGIAPFQGDAIFIASSPYSEAGFEFVGTTDFRVISDTFVNYSISNGSDNGFVQSPPEFSVAAASGAPFAIQCIDTGQAFSSAGGQIVVTGNLAKGGTVVTNIPTQTNTFNSFDFPPNWVDLASVSFSGSINFLSLDNVCLQPRMRNSLVADTVSALLPTQFAGNSFDSGNTAVVNGDVEFKDRYNGGLRGIDVDLSANRILFRFFNDHPSSPFNLGLLGLNLTDMDLVSASGEPQNIRAVVLEQSNFPANTFDAITIGPTSIMFDFSSQAPIVPNATEYVAIFRIVTFPVGTIFMHGFEDLD